MLFGRSTDSVEGGCTTRGVSTVEGVVVGIVGGCGRGAKGGGKVGVVQGSTK